jgi:hypothetical protein
MTATAFSKDFINDFVDYTLTFYGPDGIYPMGANRTLVRNATNDMIQDCQKSKVKSSVVIVLTANL